MLTKTIPQINAYFYDVVRGTVAALPANIVAAVDAAKSALDSAVPALPAVASAPASASADDLLRTAAATFLASSPSAPESTLLYLYLAHALLLPSVPLRARAQRIPEASAELMSTLLEPFLAKFYASLTAAVEALPEAEAQNPLADFDLDGRIFFILLVEVLNNADLAPEKLADFLGPDVASRVDSLWSSLSGAAQPDFGALRSAGPAQSAELPPVPATLVEDTVLPYTQSIFTAHLSSVHVAVSPDSTLATLQNKLAGDSVFSDERGWENPRPALPTHLGGAPPPVLDYRAKKKRDRKEQRFMAQMQKSAASLTGAFGASLKPQTIPSVGKRSGPTLKQQVAAIASAKNSAAASGAATPTGSEVGRDGSSTTGGRGSKKDKVKVLSSRDKLIAENAAKKLQEEGKENFKWWVERLDDLKDMTLPGQISQVQSYLKNKRAQDPWLGTEMLIKRVDLELRKWVADERREADDVADQYRVFIARTLSPHLQKYMRALDEGTGAVVINEKQGRAISNTLAVMGLECLLPEGIKWSDKLASAEDKKDKKAKAAAADEDDGKKKKGAAKPGSKAAQAAVRPPLSLCLLCRSPSLKHRH